MPATMSRRLRTAALVGAASVFAVLAAASPAAALPAFGTAPVSLPNSGPGGQATIQSVVVGRHDSEGFDRVVFTIATAGLPAVTAQYVPQVTADGSGKPVPLLGTAFLQVTMRSTTPGSPQQTITPSGFLALKQVKGAGDFEAVTSYGLGQETRAGFRVFTLTAPNRVVIDVAAPPGSHRTGTTTGAAAGTAAGFGTGLTPGSGTAAGSDAGTAAGSGSGPAAGLAAGTAGRSVLAATRFPILPVALVGAGVLLTGGAALLLRRGTLPASAS